MCGKRHGLHDTRFCNHLPVFEIYPSESKVVIVSRQTMCSSRGERTRGNVPPFPLCASRTPATRKCTQEMKVHQFPVTRKVLVQLIWGRALGCALNTLAGDTLAGSGSTHCVAGLRTHACQNESLAWSDYSGAKNEGFFLSGNKSGAWRTAANVSCPHLRSFDYFGLMIFHGWFSS